MSQLPDAPLHGADLTNFTSGLGFVRLVSPEPRDGFVPNYVYGYGEFVQDGWCESDDVFRKRILAALSGGK